MSDAIITADYMPHAVGDREVVSWDRPDGKRYFNVPIYYVREATREEYLENHPHVILTPDRCHFWEVSFD